MNRITIAAAAIAVCGFAGAASAAPLGIDPGLSVGSAAENIRVVCRERTVWRTNKWGEPRRVTVRDCDRVGRRWDRGPRYGYDGPRRGRYYHEGHYYEDPGFTIRIR